jgi:hypothetical protein
MWKLYQFIGHTIASEMTKRTNDENASRLLDILDRHLNEKNFEHNPTDLFWSIRLYKLEKNSFFSWHSQIY